MRQVYVHCNERGELLDTVRVHLESQLTQARSRLAEQHRELQQLRRETSLLMGNPGGPERRASKEGGARGQHDAKRDALDQQRVTALASSARFSSALRSASSLAALFCAASLLAFSAAACRRCSAALASAARFSSAL